MKQWSFANWRDPRGWYYQALIHGILLQVPKPNFINMAFPGVPASDPQVQMAQAVWATCPHHMVEFLAWHRIYVHFFERIVRKAAGDDAFALPYWDYSNGDGTLPVEFREAVDGTPLGNSLFDHARDPSVNGLFGTTPVPQQPQDVSLDALKEPTFSATAGRAGFTNALENTPHDLVHGGIGGDGFFGNAGDMSNPATAGRDPVFWMHHCNIDRLWESWLVKGGETTASYASEDWYTRRWPFIDENGQLQRLSLQDLDQAATGAEYDRLEQIPRDPIVEVATTSVPITSGPLSLTEAVSVPLAPLESVPEGASRRVELRDVRPPLNAAVTFDVFIANGETEQLIGAFNFFGAVHEDMVMPLRLVFPMPESIPADAPVSLEIRPRSPVIGTPPVVGSISILVQ